jgi:PAS domain-containing protein
MGVKISSVTLREETYIVYENRVLWRIFGPKRGELVGGWRRLHNEEFHNPYAKPNIIKVN